MVRALKSLVFLASALGALSTAAGHDAGDSLMARGEQLEKRLGVIGESPEIVEEDVEDLDGDLPQDDLDLSDNYPVGYDDEVDLSGNSTFVEFDETADDEADDDADDEAAVDAELDDELAHGNATTLEARANKAKYKKHQKITGDGFFKAFNFNTFADPTHGRVDYVSMKTAKSLKLATAAKGKFVMRADAKNKVKGNQRGRKSIRITSKKAYKTHVVVLDVRHMPQGTATWPAFWEFGADWPNKGELDIIEGANDKGPNLSSLHTSPGCTQPAKRNMKGQVATNDCNAFAGGNVGCGVRTDSNRSFGPNLNKNGGGWFAAERTSKYIKVWFWSRKDKGVPKEVKNGVGAINPDKWGKPTALFVSNSCPISKKFGPNNIVINLTFCGDWAGNTFPGGMGACLNMVNSNPGAFKNAYWNLARLSIYT
ncbi:hypothetical protein AURDEDRAFT_181533 [Auricularia subglabra TFB-10046 SS5]|nr:hypothetical protein AURDEDRAFT_181533 [Auricularia subglabra TFB-10046 SS5]